MASRGGGRSDARTGPHIALKISESSTVLLYTGSPSLFYDMALLNVRRTSRAASAWHRPGCSRGGLSRSGDGIFGCRSRIDENLAVKFFHYYLMKFYKNLPDVFTVGSTSNNSRGSLARLHLRLACIAVIPLKKWPGQGRAGRALKKRWRLKIFFLFWSFFNQYSRNEPDQFFSKI
jgi:hypothetical protein